MKILMVCLGNICRSPLAHGIMQDRIMQNGLPWAVDSAGTGGWHAGEAPDFRSILEAKKHSLDISKQQARKITLQDFQEFDLILTMDAQNYNDVLSLTSNREHRDKVKMIMNYLEPGKNIPVPDPYYDGKFALVYEMLENAIDQIVLQLAGTEV